MGCTAALGEVFTGLRAVGKDWLGGVPAVVPGMLSRVLNQHVRIKPVYVCCVS